MAAQEKIFKEFPPVTTADWEKKIKEDLRGEDYDKKLIWRTADDLHLSPYYRQEDLTDLSWLGAEPSQFPYLRGNQDISNGWMIRQDLVVRDAMESNKIAVKLLSRGTGSLGFLLPEDLPSISKLLKDIPLQEVPVNFDAGPHPELIIDQLSGLIRDLDIEPDQLSGCVENDPLAAFCMNRCGADELNALLEKLPALLETAETFRDLRMISIRGDHYHNSGANPAAELAWSLAAGCEYLDRLTGAGLEINRIVPKIQFHFATGPVYFMEIAKLRAARLLWSHIVKAFDPKDARSGKTFIHSSTSGWNQTVYDPHVNILRGTTEAMSAIIGGTNSLSVLPFDHPYRDSTEFSRRLAGNIQIILKEESYFDKVIDPGAGSYYIEKLTDALASKAWDLFTEIENSGGFYQALCSNTIQKQIRETADTRIQEIATRKEILLGTNEYPNFEERIPDDYQPGKLDAVKNIRAASEFELLRLKTERSDPVPAVFMFTFGPVSMRRARAVFSCNFFACGGFRIIDNIGFSTVEEGLQAISEQQPEIVILCSADDEYPGLVKEFMYSLKNGPILVIAGHPKDHIDTLSKMGVEHYIHLRSDVLKELKKFQEMTVPTV